MRNQDPLKPMESTEFIGQLATFSGVEQQVRANDRLDGILSALGGGSSAGLAEWIGREVRAPAAGGVRRRAGGGRLDRRADGADKAVLVVTNDFGTVVARRRSTAARPRRPGTAPTTSATPAAHGDYGFTVESYDGDTLLGTQTGNVYTTVTEVRIADGSPTLVVARRRRGRARLPSPALR